MTFWVSFVLLLGATACQTKTPPPPTPTAAAPEVHNVVTDYVERGQNTMTRAEAAATAANARNQQLQQQSQSFDPPAN